MYKKYFKRIFDVIFACALLIILCPLFLLISILIKLDSKGPVIFKQIRSGKNNIDFTLYKFRTMVSSNDVYDKTRKDEKTFLGKFLRGTSLDELPQLINILKGEMSFIGPRPWIIEYAQLFNDEQMHRLDVLPGLTGLAQCSGRNNLTVQDRIRIDLIYVNNLSLRMDLKAIIDTLKCILNGEGVSSSKETIHGELRSLAKQNHKNVPIIEEEVIESKDEVLA